MVPTHCLSGTTYQEGTTSTQDVLHAVMTGPPHVFVVNTAFPTQGNVSGVLRVNHTGRLLHDDADYQRGEEDILCIITLPSIHIHHYTTSNYI